MHVRKRERKKIGNNNVWKIRRINWNLEDLVPMIENNSHSKNKNQMLIKNNNYNNKKKKNLNLNNFNSKIHSRWWMTKISTFLRMNKNTNNKILIPMNKCKDKFLMMMPMWSPNHSQICRRGEKIWREMNKKNRKNYIKILYRDRMLGDKYKLWNRKLWKIIILILWLKLL